VRSPGGVVFLFLLTTLAACGSGGSDNPADAAGSAEAGPDAAAASCEAESTITVAGAFIGTRNAPTAASSHSNQDDAGLVDVIALFGSPFLSSWSFTFMGEPRLTTYTEATNGVLCGVGVTDAADLTRVWAATKGVQGTPDQGTCSLTITSVTATLVLSTQTQYCVHGSVQAMLPPKPGGTATGTVTLSASF
jgi:hypothetical protein